MVNLMAAIGLLSLLWILLGVMVGWMVSPLPTRAALMGKLFKKRFGIAAVVWPTELTMYIKDFGKGSFVETEHRFIFNLEEITRIPAGFSTVPFQLFDSKDALPPAYIAISVPDKDKDGKPIMRELSTDEKTGVLICVPKSFKVPYPTLAARDPAALEAFTNKQKMTAETKSSKRQKLMFWIAALSLGMSVLVLIYMFFLGGDIATVHSGQKAILDAISNYAQANSIAPILTPIIK